jgi:aminocarboxymuconate-semialdehyde decarboxylase
MLHNSIKEVGLVVIDWEHHYLPEELWLKKGGKRGESVTVYEHGSPRGTLHPQLYDVEEHLKVMDAVGIDMAVLSIGVSQDNTRIVLEECKVYDERVGEIINKYPKRFSGVAPVPPLGGAEAFAELDRAIKSLGMRGVVIRSQVEGLSLDSEKLYPFYERVSSLNVPIYVHPSGVQLGFELLKAPYELGRSLGRELDLEVATARIILSGVLEDFPDLKFVISHLGGGISAVKERMDYYFGARGMTSKGMRKSFHEYFEKIYFDMAGFAGGMNAVKCALTSIRPSRLVFGSDYPQNFIHDPDGIRIYIENIRKLELDEESKRLMLGENAKKLLGLS